MVLINSSRELLFGSEMYSIYWVIYDLVVMMIKGKEFHTPMTYWQIIKIEEQFTQISPYLV